MVFVTHSMWLFQHLATSGLQLAAGRVVNRGTPAEIVDGFIADIQSDPDITGDGPDLLARELVIDSAPVAPPDPGGEVDAGDGRGRPVTFTCVEIAGAGDEALRSGGPMVGSFEVDSSEAIDAARFGFMILTADLAVCITADLAVEIDGGEPDGCIPLPVGRTVVRYRNEAIPLLPGRYAVRCGLFDRDTNDVLALHGVEDTHVDRRRGGRRRRP